MRGNLDQLPEPILLQLQGTSGIDMAATYGSCIEFINKYMHVPIVYACSLIMPFSAAR